MEALPLLSCQFINPIDMELKHKELYQSPVTIVVELKFEGIICISGDVNATMNGVFSEETI